jgi:hypothetical protein
MAGQHLATIEERVARSEKRLKKISDRQKRIDPEKRMYQYLGGVDVDDPIVSPRRPPHEA